mgnify:CR=1 FL=1
MRTPTGTTRERTAAGARALLLALTMVAGAGAVSLAAAGEVVVYSARSQYGQEPAIDAFTKKTGIQVKSFGGNTSELFDRLKAEGDKTPADVLITVDAGNLWNAGRAGLLSRIDSPEIAANVPANLRDPEGRWIGAHRARPHHHVQHRQGEAGRALDLRGAG